MKISSHRSSLLQLQLSRLAAPTMGKPGAGKGSQGRRPKGDAAKHKGTGSGGLPHPRSEPSGLGGTVQMPRSHVVTSLPGPGPNFISRVSHNVLAVIADMIRNAVAGNPQPVRKRLLLCTPGPARHARSHGSAAGGFPKAGGKPPTNLRLQTAESQRAQ